MLVRKYGPNPRGRDLVAGDVHGHYDALIKELIRLGFRRDSDRLFFLGDLIDRGPDSFKCLQLVYQPWAASVIGNHEQMMRAALSKSGTDRDLMHWIKNGGLWYLSEDDQPGVAQVGLDAISRMPYAIELQVGDKVLGMVHAEPPREGWDFLRSVTDWADDELIEDVKEHMLWSRKRIRANDAAIVSGIDAVVCGHTIVSDHVRLGNVSYIDTGAYREEGRLTVLDVRDLF